MHPMLTRIRTMHNPEDNWDDPEYKRLMDQLRQVGHRTDCPLFNIQSIVDTSWLTDTVLVTIKTTV